MLYAIAGEGPGNATEIEATLADLREASTEGEDFWFVLEGKETLTKADKVILKWLVAEGIYFEVAGEESDTYEGAQAFHDEGLVDIMVARKAEDEEVVFLTLFVDADDTVEEDAALFALFEAADEAGIEVRLLNGQMTRIQLSADDEEAGDDDDDGEEVVEEVEEDLPAAAEAGDEAETAFSEADLKKMSPPELKAVAKGQGINVTRDGKALGKGDLIAAILAGGQQAAAVATAPSAAPSAVVRSVSTNGDGAMLIVVLNGSIHIRPVSAEEAASLV